MTFGALLDRLCFWNLPGFVSSYELPLAHKAFFHDGVEVWEIPGSEYGPTVLYCHGNGGNLRFPDARRDRILALHRAGANIWIFDYRGYGNSPGHPSEAGLYEDAKRVHALVRDHHPSGRPFVLYGRSLGGAVASYLATEVEMPDQMILESTFTSATDVCASYIGRALASHMNHKFDSLGRISEVTCPLYLIHGTADWIVRYKFSRQLFEACPEAVELVSVEGAGHNNLQARARGLYEETLYRWLNPIAR